LVDAGCGAIGWDAGEQTACGLWVNQQRGYLVRLRGRTECRQESDIISMQRTGDTPPKQRQRTF
jgi:hypothetical protein